MPGRIIDCCSLLNLHTGWGGLENLRLLPYAWSICDAAARESEFTREYTESGAIIEVPLDLGPHIQSGLLQVARPETADELANYVQFATQIDDGEAQALAIAKSRGYTLLTDDRKALRIARRPDVAVATVTTAGVLRDWQAHRSPTVAELRVVIERIQTLARFAPNKDSPDRTWWLAQLQQQPPTA